MANGKGEVHFSGGFKIHVLRSELADQTSHVFVRAVLYKTGGIFSSCNRNMRIMP